MKISISKLILIGLTTLGVISRAAVCSVTTFPTTNAALTTSGEAHTFTAALAGQLTLTDLTCTTNGVTANTPAYGQINLGFDLTSTSAGNVCSRTQGSLPTYVQNHGTFIYSAADQFVNAAGSVLTSGYGDSTSGSTVYYTGAKTIWIGSESCSAPNNPIALTTSFTFYCYDAAYTTSYCIWETSLTNAEATSNVGATALEFQSTPTTAQTACQFSVKPSTAMTVELTSTGTPLIGCATNTATGVWGYSAITTATTTTFTTTSQVICIMLAQGSTSSTGVTMAATFTGSSAVQTLPSLVLFAMSLFYIFLIKKEKCVLLCLFL